MTVTGGTSNALFFAEKLTVCNSNADPSGDSGPKYNIHAYGRTSWNEWNPVFDDQLTGPRPSSR